MASRRLGVPRRLRAGERRWLRAALPGVGAVNHAQDSLALAQLKRRGLVVEVGRQVSVSSARAWSVSCVVLTARGRRVREQLVASAASRQLAEL